MENETFSYTYSAQEQSEVQQIRDKYVTKEKTKLEQLKELDASIYRGPITISITLGIISALIFGTGMCCVMVWNLMLIGILVGLLGAAGMALVYFLYNHMVDSNKANMKDKILALCDEISNSK